MSDLVVEVAADAYWVPLAIEGDVDAESAATAVELLRARGDESPGGDRLEDVTAMLAGLARQARALADEDDEDEGGLAGAFALVPEEEPVVLTVATLRAIDGAASADDLADALVAPPEYRYDDPVVETVETPTGTAVRVAQRVVGPDTSVSAWFAYAWALPDADVTLVLSTTFVDLVEAAQWGEMFDNLANGVSAWVEE